MSEYYEENASDFFSSTVDVDMTPIYERFLPFVVDGGAVLDAGCGSGRDALHFKALGYEVTAIDASESLCKLASELLDQEVQCVRFDEIVWERRFDAVWACASLLHVPRDELVGVFSKLSHTLKPGGLIYASFKYGDTEREKDGRNFTDMNESLFEDLMSSVSSLELKQCWITHDRRPNRDESWLNVILELRLL